MAQLTPVALVRILGQVTLIMFVPIVGGSLIGVGLDRALGTTPAAFLTAFALGNVVAIAGIALLIRTGQRRLSTGMTRTAGTDRTDGR